MFWLDYTARTQYPYLGPIALATPGYGLAPILGPAGG